MDGIGLYNNFLRIHEPQLKYSGVPEIFWETLYNKLRNQVFDSGLYFQMAKIDYEENGEKSPTDPAFKLFVSSGNPVSSANKENIYLIDHAWTYSVDKAKDNLIQNPNLLNRMSDMMGYDLKKYENRDNDNNDDNDNKQIDFVLSEMWRYSQTYALSSNNHELINIEDRMPLWYIMDEVGSAINHSNEPNFRTVPFLYVPEGVTYTLLYPLKDSDVCEEVTRDFLEEESKDLMKKKALLLPWVKDYEDSLMRENYLWEEPEENYFLEGRIRESFRNELEEVKAVAYKHPEGMKLKVYSQYDLVNEYLNDYSLFEIVANEQDADVLWLTSHFKEYHELSIEAPNVFINQFPFENILTVKDLLCVVCRRKGNEKNKCNLDTLETFPSWFPTTYNLKTELVKFVSYFKNRESRNLDNHWICKPWNLARGLDTHITNNLFHILRLPSTGPKIAQKYIENPVLYYRSGIGKVKFDVRYVVLLKSVNPLQVYIYKNFFLRFSNKEFSLDNFFDYEKHFTVMNYIDEEQSSLYHLKCEDFILEWMKQYPEFSSWHDTVEVEIMKMFKAVFEAAISEKPPRGIGHNLQSRAVYAADVMLEWRENHIQPLLLEINFTPDCKRACDYYPDFYNQIFKLLFLDVENHNVFYKL